MGLNVSRYKEIFSFKFATIGGLFMGGMVFLFQIQGGFHMALIAGVKQFVYTFIISSMLIAITESIVIAKQNSKYPVFYGVFVAWVITIILSSGLHLLKGTPHPLNAILINMVLVPPGLIFLGFRKKRELKKSATLNSNLQ